MPSNILIHIGFPKTGSTFLQYWLQRHPQIHYHSGSLGGFRDPKEIAEYAYQNDGPHKVFAISEEDLSALGGKVEKRGVQPNLFDTERWQTNTCKTLHALFPRATVVIVTRGFESLLRSGYSEYIKFGGILAFTEFLEEILPSAQRLYNYSFLINTYIQYFGNDNVLVLPYELLKNEPEVFLSEIRGRFELDKEDFSPVIKNESLNNIFLYKYRMLSLLLYNITKPLPGIVQKVIYNRYPGFLCAGKMEWLMRMIPGKPVSLNIPVSALQIFKNNAEILQSNKWVQPYLKEYLLDV